MMKMLYIFFISFLLFGCQSEQAETPAADDMIKSYLNKHNISIDQFNQTQDTSHIIFALGEARSKSLSIARSKAQMDAREKLLWRNSKNASVAEKTLKNTYVLQYYVDRQGAEFLVKCLIAGEREKK